MKQFYCTTKVVTGPGAVAALKELQAQKLLLVTDPYFDKNGTAARIAADSGAKTVEIFSDVTPDPTVELAAAGTAKLKQLQPDVVVALGGGSAMDCAKAMVYFAESDAKLVAIPTTSGSGSEVTDFAVLTHGGVKYPLVDRKLLPHMAILDSALLASLPRSLIADAGFDVLAHALEAYVAQDASAITDALAADAFCTVYGLLPASYGGNTRVRLNIHVAATMAGMAFSQAGLGLCHAMSHSLGGMFHVPHGRLNAILLPAVIGCNAHAAGEKYAHLAALAGIGGSAKSMSVRSLQNSLIRLRRELGLPISLAQAGIDPQALHRSAHKIAEATLADPCCRTNPMKVEAFLVHKILEEVAGRG